MCNNYNPVFYNQNDPGISQTPRPNFVIFEFFVAVWEKEQTKHLKKKMCCFHGHHFNEKLEYM